MSYNKSMQIIQTHGPLSGTQIIPRDPIQQIEDEKHSEIASINLDHLTKKYNRYKQEFTKEISTDPLYEVIKSKDTIIDDLTKRIESLEKQLVDTTILYNTKIEQLRMEHKNELRRQHAEFVKRSKN